MRLYLNAHNLEGEFTTEDIIPDMCDVMMAGEDTFRFMDAWDVKTSVTRDAEDVLHFDINMLCKDTVMYHATMYLPPLECLHDADYRLERKDGYQLLALRQGTDGQYAEYTLQFGNAEYRYDNLQTGEGHYEGNLFSFYLGHDGLGLAGEYGYSAGTLADDEPHLFFEDGTEVRVGPVAGTLTVTPLAPVTLYIGSQRYNTSIYDVEFHFVGQNGTTYNGKGNDFLVCIDGDSDEDDIRYVEITEPLLDGIREQLAEQGYKVRKTLQGARMLIVSPDATYSADGTLRQRK